MTSPLSERTVATVKATIPALEAHGLEIVRTMYERMFRDSAIRDLFNQSHHGETGSQPKALAGAILAYGRNIDNLAVLGEAVERIAQKHVGLQIRPEHYPVVAEALLGAISEVLGEAATPEVLDAWGEAYWFLANILIGREGALYRELETADGGWSGWRQFTIEAKIRESDIVTSFVLRPADGGAVIRHRPGQYLTFRLSLPGDVVLKRNYSISSAPDGQTYRITVKRELKGSASNWLHDAAEVGTILDVAPPAGEFVLKSETDAPVVLLSGGVGLTPMVSMLETLVGRGEGVPVHYVHGTQDGATHAMGKHVKRLVSGRSEARLTTFYLSPRPEDEIGRTHDVDGMITLDWLREHTPIESAHYYLCGPKAFLAAFVHGLQRIGVPPARIHYEFFGPADDLSEEPDDRLAA
ncbi:NO-inducible flavohemoprotein [Aureimonas sp. Leaf324]|uniref:NO-inducible flavohemoprotein n=1 Tax=Aureimonas sp. Leaf324 TaxID=1736336 RepID=UPI0006FF8644|nr:NO-inducible flavohemoprotein [Aureimonas sp. Leaf324]KQQ91023.1 dihydropteridine reductase [Aureimonas sp. Leaf324]